MANRPAALVLLLPVFFACQGGAEQPADRMVDLGSHSLHAVVVGRGLPAVVFDGGIGARGGEYRGLQERIAAITTAVTYDRAGYGPSGTGPLPRDSRREAEELRALLARLKIAPPYVFVGHSLGGLNVQVYASLHPEEVAGMVLLDPPPLGFLRGEDFPELAAMAAGMTAEWQGVADAGLRAENPEEKANAQFFRMLASEHREMFAASAGQATSIPSFGDIPLVVFASGAPNPAFGEVAEAYQAFWARESAALAAKSGRGRFVFAATSTHRLHADAADLVADSITSLVRSLQGPGR